MRSIVFVILLFLSGCGAREDAAQTCVTNEKIGIQFTSPFSYSESDILVIDGVEFTHVDYLDSLALGNYLPNRNPVILEMEGKQAREDSNEISIGRALARRLILSGNYNILNGPELLTTGKLKVSRKDGARIKICMPKRYSAVLFE